MACSIVIWVDHYAKRASVVTPLCVYRDRSFFLRPGHLRAFLHYNLALGPMVFILLIVIAIVVCIGAGIACLLWLPYGRKVGGVEPRCAGCGYIICGLPAPRCPECGADLGGSGAVVTTGRLRPGRVARLIAWSAFCMLAVVIPAGLLWLALVTPALPRISDSSGVMTFNRPVSKGYNSVAVRTQSHQMMYPVAGAYPPVPDTLPDGLYIDLVRSDGTSTMLSVDSATLQLRNQTAAKSSMSPAPLDADALVAWLKSVGVQGETDQLNKEMSTVMTEVQHVVSHPPTPPIFQSAEFGSVGLSTSASQHPLPWVDGVPLLIGAIVWAIGTIRIVRKPPIAAGDSQIGSQPEAFRR